MSKILEKLICRQITFLEENNLLRKMQSAYRRHHSTETAVLKIVSGILCTADRGDVTFLCLLDLFAALDAVDHDILVERIEKAFSLCGQVLEWIKSFLYRRTQTVMLNEKQSTWFELQIGVSQTVYSDRSYSSCIRRRHRAKISRESSSMSETTAFVGRVRY